MHECFLPTVFGCQHGLTKPETTHGNSYVINNLNLIFTSCAVKRNMKLGGSCLFGDPCCKCIKSPKLKTNDLSTRSLTKKRSYGKKKFGYGRGASVPLWLLKNAGTTLSADVSCERQQYRGMLHRNRESQRCFPNMTNPRFCDSLEGDH